MMSNTWKIILGFGAALALLFIVMLGTVRSQEVCSVNRTQIEDFLKANNPQAISVELTSEQFKHLKAAYAFHNFPLDPTITHILTSPSIQEGSMYLFMFNDAGCLVTKGPLEIGHFTRALDGQEEGPVA